MKGVSGAVSVYEVSAISGQESLCLDRQQSESISLIISVQGTLLDGKHLSDIQFEGKIVRLSSKVIEVQANRTLPAFSNVKLNCAIDDCAIELYAKVLNRPVEQEFYLQLTTTSAEFDRLIEIESGTQFHK